MLKNFYDFFNILNLKQKKNFIFYFILLFIIGIIEVTGLITIVPLVNIFLTKELPEYLLFLKDFFSSFFSYDLLSFTIFYLGLVVLFYLLKFIIISISYYFQIKFSFHIQKDISVKILSNIMKDDFFHFSKKKTPSIIRDSIGEVALLSGAIQSYLLLFFELITLVIVLAAIFIIFGIKIIFISLAFSIIFAFFFKLISNYLKKLGKIRQTQEEKRINIIKDSLGSLKEIKFLSLEDKLIDQFSDSTQIAYHANSKNIFLKFVPRYAVDFFAILIFFFFALFYLKNNNLNEFSVFSAILVVLMSRVIPSISRLLSYVQNIKFNEVVIENLNLKLADKNILEVKKTLPNSFYNLNFKNILFKYEESKNLILKNFGFELNKGDKILITGESGCGKSTFLDILIGLQKKQNGEIFYNNKQVHDYHLLRLNSEMSYLPQQPYLFNKSINYNITLDDLEQINNEKLNQCIKLSKLDTFVKDLPNSNKTIIGEDGSKLSGGQKQRIGIARAIYNLKSILILDEPTSFLDEKTELAVMKNILNIKDITLVVVSHNKKFAEFFDKVIDFNNN